MTTTIGAGGNRDREAKSHVLRGHRTHMSEDSGPNGEAGPSDPGDSSDEHERSPREQARRLATRLRFLRMRERTANFENREAIRREMRRTEEDLTRLADAGGFEVNVDVRRDR